ncbi:MAG: hypothetical protein M3O70_24330 [Actinomycetota bacterium]|nr:hypothetical protein [Actinomycetota bacterium]
MSRHPIIAMLLAGTIEALFYVSFHAASGQLDLEEAPSTAVLAGVAGFPVYWYARMLPRQIRSWQVWRAKQVREEDVVANDSR